MQTENQIIVLRITIYFEALLKQYALPFSLYFPVSCTCLCDGFMEKDAVKTGTCPGYEIRNSTTIRSEIKKIQHLWQVF